LQTKEVRRVTPETPAPLTTVISSFDQGVRSRAAYPAPVCSHERCRTRTAALFNVVLGDVRITVYRLVDEHGGASYFARRNLVSWALNRPWKRQQVLTVIEGLNLLICDMISCAPRTHPSKDIPANRGRYW
jgi:hypothetical protein